MNVNSEIFLAPKKVKKEEVSKDLLFYYLGVARLFFAHPLFLKKKVRFSLKSQGLEQRR